MRKFNSNQMQVQAVVLLCVIGVIGGLSSNRTQAVQSDVAVVSAASFERQVAPDSIAAAFGARLATTTEIAKEDVDPNTPGVQLPLTLGGTTVEINGQSAGLFFVSPNQINFLVPATASNGTVSIVVRMSDGTVARGTLLIAIVAPAVFTADGVGRGVPAALLVRVKADQTQSYEPVGYYDALLGRHLTRPLHFGAGTDQIVLLLFLTGLRNAPDPNRDGNLNEVVRVSVGGLALTPAYAGRQADLAGLDQLNVELPRSLLGRGRLDLTVSVNGLGVSANPVELEMAVAASSSPLPEANNAQLPLDEDTAVSFMLSGIATRPLRYRITSLPTHGRLSGNAPNLTYTPAPDYWGIDNFTFSVNNGIDDSMVDGRINFLVRPINDAPKLSVPGAQAINISETLSFEISANDADAEQQLTFTVEPALPGARLADLTPRSRRYTWTPVTDWGGRNLTLTFRVMDSGDSALTETRVVPVTVGVLWGKTSGPEGAELTALLTNPATGDLYAGTRNGGVYRSIDAGRRWVPINGNLPVRNIYKLYLRGTRLFAGTVDGAFYTDDNGVTWRAGFRGGAALSFAEQGDTLYAGAISIGVRRSQNGGQTWQATNVFVDASSIYFDASSVDGLIARGNQLFVAVNTIGNPIFGSGLVVTTNAGENWTLVSGLPPNDGYRRVFALGENATHIFASFAGAGIYASSNNGQSWFAVNSGLTSSRLPYLAVSGSTLVTSDGSTLFRSTNNGQSWTAVDTGFSTRPISALGVNGTTVLAGTDGAGLFIRTGGSSTETWQAGSIGLANSSVGRLAVDEVNQRLYAVISNGIYVSENNGQSWTPYNILPPGDVTSLAVSGTNLLAGSSSGVYLSARATNGQGQAWVTSNNGLTERNVTTLVTLGTQVFAGTSNGVFASASNGQSWTAVSNGLGNRALAQLSANGTRLYAATADGAYVTANGGQLWTALGLVNYPLSHIAANADFLVAASRAGVFVSNDQGRSWRQITEGLDNPVSALAIRAETAYAGSLLDGVYALANNGQAWRPVNDSLTAISVRDLAVSGPNLFISTEDGVWLSTNSPQTWTPFNRNLAGLQVESLLAVGGLTVAGTGGQGIYHLALDGQWLRYETGLPINPITALVGNETTLWAGTRGSGVFRSFDQGRNWTALNSGLSNQNVNALHAFNGQIYAGTEEGAGIYRLPETGGVWAELRNGLPTTRIRALTSAATTLYAGAELGDIFRLDNQTQSWTLASRLSAPNRPVTTLDVSMLAATGTQLYAGTGGASLFLSNDGGRNWTLAAPRDLGQTLYVTAFAASGGRLYLGTSSGVFFSTDQGASWRQINAGLTSVYVKSLAVSGDKIYAGTVERGVFISKIPE